MRRMRSSSLLAGLVDQPCQPIEIVLRNVGLPAREHCRDGLFHRAVEKCFEQRIERAVAHLLPRHARRVDIARTVALVAHMALLLENREQRANGGSARRIGHLFADFRGRSLTEAIKRVHDLALPAAEPDAALPALRIPCYCIPHHAKKLASTLQAVNGTLGEKIFTHARGASAMKAVSSVRCGW